MHEHVASCHPVRHAIREALDAHALLSGELRQELLPEAFVPAAETHDLPHAPDSERLLDRAAHVADAPAATRHEHDLPGLGQPELPARVRLGARLEEVRQREAVDTVDRRVITNDRPDLGDRLRVGDEMDVDSSARPVVHRREVGDRRDDGDAEPARALEPAEHLGDVRIDGHDHVGVVALDQAEQARRSEPRHQALRDLPRRSGTGEEPEPDVPEPREPIEDDARRAFAHEGHERPIEARQSSVTSSTAGCSLRSCVASVRAGRSCPSPTLAVRMRMRGGTAAKASGRV